MIKSVRSSFSFGVSGIDWIDISDACIIAEVLKLMEIIADLQLHSRFSRAVSPAMTIQNIAMWAKRKGIGLVATGDWTHPSWFREIERDLEEMGNGLLQLRRAELPDKNLDLPAGKAGPSSVSAGQNFIGSPRFSASPYFLLATEVSSIYKQGGKVRRVHTLIWVPSLDAAAKISREMTKRGCNLLSDGRPIIGLTCIQIAELVFSIEPKALIIPAHAWTPWFSTFGSMSGFDSIKDAFGPYADQIYAVETGLSSNPSMNWRIKELDNRSIVSFSDAHSGVKLGREATVFELEDISYQSIYDAICAPRSLSSIAYTIEFYPEEGKYHYSGHRACGIRYSPEESKEKGTMCPVCGKTLIQGVEQRVGELAGRTTDSLKLSVVSHQLSVDKSTRVIGSKKFPKRPPFVMMVPLMEIISEVIGSPVTSPKVERVYTKLLHDVGSEFHILLHASLSDIEKSAGSMIATGVDRVRKGDIFIDPGFDGVFGVVKIWKKNEEGLVSRAREQLSLTL